MQKSVVTKIINQVKNHNGSESLGFVRYMYLPKRVIKSMQLSHILTHNDIKNYLSRTISFFANMNDEEYKNWLTFNA